MLELPYSRFGAIWTRALRGIAEISTERRGRALNPFPAVADKIDLINRYLLGYGRR